MKIKRSCIGQFLFIMKAHSVERPTLSKHTIHKTGGTITC